MLSKIQRDNPGPQHAHVVDENGEISGGEEDFDTRLRCSDTQSTGVRTKNIRENCNFIA